jgi:hypothetical protein
MKEIEGVSISSMAIPSPIVDIFSKLAGAEGSEKNIMTMNGSRHIPLHVSSGG